MQLLAVLGLSLPVRSPLSSSPAEPKFVLVPLVLLLLMHTILPNFWQHSMTLLLHLTKRVLVPSRVGVLNPRQYYELIKLLAATDW